MSNTNHCEIEDLLVVIATAVTEGGDICDIRGDRLYITRKLSAGTIQVATIRVDEVSEIDENINVVQTGWQLGAEVNRSKSMVVGYMQLVDGHTVDGMIVCDYDC